MRPRRKSSGFTLVELLTVIAIIGILAGLIAAGLPTALRMAKMAALKNNFNQFRTVLTAYYTDHGSFPPGYGYLSPIFLKNQFENPGTRPAEITNAIANGLAIKQTFFLLPWMAQLGEHGNLKLHDNFSRGLLYDTDADHVISRLEFAPTPIFDSGSQTYLLNNYNGLYLGGTDFNGSDAETMNDLARQQATAEARPFIYIPVNERQFRQFRKIIYDFATRQGNPSNPRPFNLDATAVSQINAQLSFPPPSYDSFVLISVGPAANSGTSGIVVDFGPGRLNLADFPAAYQYHIVALATYFLATRDAEEGGKGDGELDFDFTARTSHGEGKNSDNDLPGKYPKNAGPAIYIGGA